MATPDYTGPTMRARVVATGVNAAGESTIASDSTLESQGFPGGSALFVWGHDDAVVVPNDGTPPAWDGAFPPLGGSRLSFSHLLPGQVEDYDQFVNSVAPDPIPGMHRTETLDYVVIVAGTITMELEDGSSVELSAPDVVIQNGTRHRWANYGTEPGVLMAVSVGAQSEGNTK